MRFDLVRKLGTDGTHRVRLAVIDFWENTDGLAAERAACLKAMLASEQDPAVRHRIEQALHQRGN